jgi:hypothetical protein
LRITRLLSNRLAFRQSFGRRRSGDVRASAEVDGGSSPHSLREIPDVTRCVFVAWPRETVDPAGDPDKLRLLRLAGADMAVRGPADLLERAA